MLTLTHPAKFSSGTNDMPAAIVLRGCGYGHIYDVFFPRLESRGIGQEVANRFMVDNPLRWLRGSR